MNHYPRHIGDWIKATAHLSEVEECIYSRCLDVYYDREAPLPADAKQVCRLVRASSKPARDAVGVVLKEFFHLESDGWHNKRADEEISEFLESEPDRKEKRENEKERQRRFRERRKQLFDLLREHGVVPAYDTPMHELQAQLSRVTNEPVTQPVTRDNTTTQSQYPIPNSQEPIGVIHSAGNSTTVGALAFGPGDLTKPMVQAGIRCNPGHPDIIALAQAGCAPANVQAAIDEARRVKGEGASITQGYVAAILKRWQSEPARTLPKAQAPPGQAQSFGKAGQETAAAAQRWLEKTGETG